MKTFLLLLMTTFFTHSNSLKPEDYVIKMPLGTDIYVKAIPFEDYSKYSQSDVWKKDNTDLLDFEEAFKNDKEEIVVFDKRRKFATLFNNQDDFVKCFYTPLKVYLDYNGKEGFFHFIFLTDDEVKSIFDNDEKAKRLKNRGVNYDFQVFELSNGAIMSVFLDGKGNPKGDGTYFDNLNDFDKINPHNEKDSINGVMIIQH